MTTLWRVSREGGGMASTDAQALQVQTPRIVESGPRKTPQQPRNRLKEYLTDAEMQGLLVAGHQGRHGVRDHCLMLLAWRHGLRVSELTGLTLVDLDLTLAAPHIQVRRLKGSTRTAHELL